MQINKPKLLGITFLHILFLTAVIGVNAAIGQYTQKELLTWSYEAVEYSQVFDTDWISYPVNLIQSNKI